MKTATQTFRRFSAAKRAAQGRDIIRFADLYIVPGDGYLDAVDSIDVMTVIPEGRAAAGGYEVSGHVTPRHLKRLGNANWAASRSEVLEAGVADRLRR